MALVLIDWYVLLVSKFRKQIRISKILIHENFTGSINDIALLRLGRKTTDLTITFYCFNRGPSGSLDARSCVSS